MPNSNTPNLDESLSSENQALKVAAASMAERRAKNAEATTVEATEETPSRRDATISKVDGDMSTKEADTINPTPAADGGALDNVETVDVESEVPVTNVTDHTPEQHSVDNASENKDTMLDLPKPANTEGGDTINFLPGKSSAAEVKTASFSQILHLTDLYRAAGLLPDGDARYAKISSLENLDISIVEDRISLLQEIVAVNSTKEAATPVQRVAAVRPAPKVENPTAPAMGRITQSSANTSDTLLFVK